MSSVSLSGIDIAAASRDSAYFEAIDEQIRKLSYSDNHQVDADTTLAISGDLSREVYGLFGIPVDAIDMATLLRKIEAAAAGRLPFLLSTPNLNFLVISARDPEFRESLLNSDLCPADGMPIVWLGRLLGVPIKERIAGADLFEALKSAASLGRRLSIFLFGGAEGVASSAANALNAQPGKLTCAGSLYPGFGDVDEMSSDAIIDAVNNSGADLLIAALGAKKGQSWLMRNHHRLRIPVRSHLGAVLNIQAGIVGRAPAIMRRSGFEWLWRIKEEPYLWRRYWHDGRMLLQLLLTRALPIAIDRSWQRITGGHRSVQTLTIEQIEDHAAVTLKLSGDADVRHVDRAVSAFHAAIKTGKHVNLDLTHTRAVDPRFIGLLLMLRKLLRQYGRHLRFMGLSPRMTRQFRWHGFGFLVALEQ